MSDSMSEQRGELVGGLEGRKERVSIFIDANNFYHGCKDTIGTHDVDYRKFIATLVGNRQLVDVYYYNSLHDKNKNKEKFESQAKFYDILRKMGVKVVLCNARKKVVDGVIVYQIKGDDVNLAVDMLNDAVKDKYDTAVLVSGDGDFLPVVRVIKDERKKKVENAIFKVNQSHDLKIICQPNIIYMDNFIRKCERKHAILPFLKK